MIFLQNPPEIQRPVNPTLIREDVECRLDRDFNFISLQLLEKTYPNGQLIEKILYPDNYEEGKEEPPYPRWNTLFECKEEFLSGILKRDINELAKIGIYLMEVEETNAMMFICPIGDYDFFDVHWIPLYRDVLKWA